MSTRYDVGEQLHLTGTRNMKKGFRRGLRASSNFGCATRDITMHSSAVSYRTFVFVVYLSCNFYRVVRSVLNVRFPYTREERDGARARASFQRVGCDGRKWRRAAIPSLRFTRLFPVFLAPSVPIRDSVVSRCSDQL